VANLNLKGSLKVSQPAPNQQKVTGNLALSDFNGQFGSNHFSNFGITSDLDINSTLQEVQLRKVSGRILQGQTAGGNFELTGTYGLSNKVAQINAKLDGFNENGLSPFLQPALGDKKLNSVLVTATANVQYDPEASSTIKAGLQVTNLVVNDPSHQVPATPLSAGFQLDTSMNHQVVDLRQCQMNLTPTQRGSNQLQLTGRVDMSQTNAIQGALNLASDSLDLTTYYDLFSGSQNATPNKAAPGGAAPATSTASSAPEKEPDAKPLPFRNFTFDANIRRLYLHEVEIDDWQTSVKLDGGHVVVSPCKLTLNGAPVNASVDTDMGVPGFKYDVSFDAQAIPLAPLVNTFKPQQKGILSGTLTGQAKIDGAGITGPSLQKNLSGNYDLSSTNLNLAVDNVQNKFLKPVLQAITTIPDILQNPGNLGSSLLSGVMGGSKSLAANTNSITRSPIEAIIAKGTIGSGKINLQQTVIQSPSFEAQANGSVELAPIITNSTLNIPIEVSLARPLAQALLLAPTNTPTSQTYVQLPSFLTQTGTIGKPQTKTDKKVLFTAAAQIAATKYGDKGALGGLLQQGQSLLGGSSGTNSADTNRSGSLGGLLRGLEGGREHEQGAGN
jgi:hypothetical protein